MPMELWLEMVAEHDVATEVVHIGGSSIGMLEFKKDSSSSSLISSRGGKMVKVSFWGTHLCNGIKS